MPNVKVKRKSPGGKNAIREKKAKTGKAHCGRCGKILGGVESRVEAEMRKLSKTERVPERAYTGVLCGRCLEDLLRYKVRFEAKSRHPDLNDLELHRDLTLEKFLPRGWFSSLEK